MNCWICEIIIFIQMNNVWHINNNMVNNQTFEEY